MEYNKLVDAKTLETTVKSLEEKGYHTFVANISQEALAKIKELIPDGASVMNGSSQTLEQIGYTELLESGNHKWIDLHAKVTVENDPAKRSEIRRNSVLSDYYLGSVHALTEGGEFIIASNTGSQLPHIVFTSPNLIFVVSTKKIVKNLDEAMDRLEKYVYPMEDKSLMESYNAHTAINKLLIFKGEAAKSARKINFILVKADLGF